MIRISLIIPFYGVEKYIQACLESVFCQNVPETEYEVICVNDCSLDKSEEIVLEYKKRHSNLHLIRHEVNKRLGAARNTGLRYAKGEYVWFIDSDDYIKKNCLREVLTYCTEDNLEILHWAIQDNSGDWILRLQESPVQTGINDLLNGSRDMTFPWNRVYKRRFLMDNNLWFNDYWGGDVIHTIQALNVAKLVKNVPHCYYFYRVDNPTSDMHSPVSAKKTISFSYVLAQVLDNSIDSLDSSLSPLMHECVEWRINQSFKPIVKLDRHERTVFYRSMASMQELRRFVMGHADFRVNLLLRFPFVSTVLHLGYRILQRLKAFISYH